MNESSTSARRWFVYGAAGGLMIFSTLNALSWFYLSNGWSDLCGATQNASVDAVGFPFEIWREGNWYGSGWVVNFPMAAVNLIFAAAMVVGLGFLAATNCEKLEKRFALPKNEPSPKRKRRLTFSVRGLMVATTIAAVFLGVSRMLGFSPWLLGAIYFAGPLVLILIAMSPVGLPWQQRVVILVFFALIMLGGSIAVGSRLGMEFDRVLFGIYICWVPQSVLAAVFILAWNAFSPKHSAQIQ